MINLDLPQPAAKKKNARSGPPSILTICYSKSRVSYVRPSSHTYLDVCGTTFLLPLKTAVEEKALIHANLEGINETFSLIPSYALSDEVLTFLFSTFLSWRALVVSGILTPL